MTFLWNSEPLVAPSNFDPHSARPTHTLTEAPLGPVIGPGERAAARPYPIDLLARSLGGNSGGNGGGGGNDGGGTGAAAGDETGTAAGGIPPGVAARIAAIGELAQDLKAKGDEARRLGEALRRLEDEQRELKAKLVALLGATNNPQSTAKASRRRPETEDERTARALSLLSSGEPPALPPGVGMPKATWS
jgi:hypothetical protein